MSALRRTPLHAAHRRLGARMVPFAGFEMPVQYASIVDEHRAVRERAGLFDISHMGQIHLLGGAAVATAEHLVSCRVADLAPGRVRYGLLLNERGGVVDDVTVHRLAEDALFLCVNAANIAKDQGWIERHAEVGARVENRSDATAMLALQGPASPAILSRLCTPDPSELRRFRFLRGQLAGAEGLVARTGYTGSDGFEIYLPAGRSPAVFETLLRAGAEHGLVPAGLGARDTLRLEAALPLYGHELSEDTTPLEAGLARFVKLDTGGFLGAEALRRQAQRGIPRSLAGFELVERGVARAGHGLEHDGEVVGRVTSGGPSPSLGRSIGLGYLPPSLATPGTGITVRIRGRGLAARVVKTPFVAPGTA